MAALSIGAGKRRLQYPGGGAFDRKIEYLRLAARTGHDR